MMTRKVVRLLPWLALAAIIFATVSPIGLRPHDVLPVNVDRALAFMVTAILFVVAYPRQWVLCAVLLIGGAYAIEALQLLSPTRHAHFLDASIKAAGALIGTFAGWSVNRFRPRLPSTKPLTTP